MHTNVLGKEHSKKALRSFSRKLENNVLQLLQNNLSISFGRDVINMSPADIVRVISELSVDNSAELSIRNTVLESVIECEKFHKFAGIICCLSFCEFMRKTLDEDVLEQNLHDISIFSRKSSLEQALNYLKHIVGDNTSYNISLNAIKLAGSDGRIIVDATPSGETYVATGSGYQFHIAGHETFLSSTKMQKWQRDNVLCLIIDGIVERPSEIEKIMYQVSETKQPCLLIARGFSEEVIATLSVNYMRSTLDVVPVCVPMDEQGINMLNDLAVVCGTDIVSSLKGELISQKTVKDLSIISSALINSARRTIILENNSSKRRVHFHANEIAKKLEKIKNKNLENSDSVVEILEKRMMSLSGDSVKIKVGKNLGDKRGIVLDRINFMVLSFRDICRFGFIDTSNIDKTYTYQIQNIIEKINFASDVVPSLSLIYGIRKGHILSNLMNNVGCIIFQDA